MATISLFTPINYTRPKSCAERVLSTLSNYFYLGGTRATVFQGDEVKLGNGKVSWQIIALKVASYVLLLPLTFPLLAINFGLRYQHKFTIIIPTQLGRKSGQELDSIFPSSSNQELIQKPIADQREPEQISHSVATVTAQTVETDKQTTVIFPLSSNQELIQESIADQREPEQTSHSVATVIAQTVSVMKKMKLDETVQSEQAKLIQVWIEQNGKDYVAHAIWDGNIEKVIREGAVLPGEAVLKKTGNVEYEKGSTYGTRGVRTLINIKEKDKILFKTLSEKEKKQLEELKYKQKAGLSPQEKKELKEIENEIMQVLEEEKKERLIETREMLTIRNGNNKALLKRLTELTEEGLKLLPEIKQTRYQFFVEKRKNFSPENERDLKLLERKKQGLFFIFTREVDSIEFHYSEGTQERRDEIKSLLKEYIGVQDITNLMLSYFLQEEDQLYRYLTHKYEQWTSKEVSSTEIDQALCVARDHTFGCWSEKLNCEIRTSKNGICWKYGNCVLLRGGKTQEIIDHRYGSEAILLPPWKNKGEYFSLPLNEEHTILLGPQKDLEPHLEQLKKLQVKFAYLESLTEEQANFFKVL